MAQVLLHHAPHDEGCSAEKNGLAVQDSLRCVVEEEVMRVLHRTGFVSPIVKQHLLQHKDPVLLPPRAISVRDKQAMLDADINNVREDMAHATGQLNVLEKRTRDALDVFEHQTNEHMDVLEGKAQKLRGEQRKEFVVFADDLRGELRRIGNNVELQETDLRKLQIDNKWLLQEVKKLLGGFDGVMKQTEDFLAACRSERETAEDRWLQFETRFPALQAEVVENHADIRTLHEKLQTAVVDGFAAVDRQFRDAIKKQVDAIRVEFSRGHQDEVEDLRNELEGKLENHELNQQQLRAEAAAIRKELVRAQQRSGPGADRQVIAREVEAQLSDHKAIQQGLHAKVVQATENIESMTEHAASVGHRIELSQDHNERKHRELQLSIEQRCRELQIVIAKLDQSVDGKLQQVSEVNQTLGKDNSQKLQAVAYSLLDIIEEVQFGGSAQEAGETRSKLHKDLCLRLGAGSAALNVNEPQPQGGGHTAVTTPSAGQPLAARAGAASSARPVQLDDGKNSQTKLPPLVLPVSPKAARKSDAKVQSPSTAR